MDGHVLVVGGVGIGKSSCIAIPTLQNWKQRAFVIDIKGELYEKIKYKHNIKVFNPLDGNSHGYDPFSNLRKFFFATSQEARAISQSIIPLPPNTHDPFWIENAQAILTSAILHYNEQELSFLDTLRAIQSTAPKTLIKKLSTSTVYEATYLINSLLDIDDKVLSSIMAELSRNIAPFIIDRDIVSALSREKNITPDDLEYGYDIMVL